MDTQKEAWKDDVLGSLDGMLKAEASPFLYTRILAKLEAEISIVPAQKLWGSALCLMLLFILNFAVLHETNINKTRNPTRNHIPNPYQLDNTNYLY